MYTAWGQEKWSLLISGIRKLRRSVILNLVMELFTVAGVIIIYAYALTLGEVGTSSGVIFNSSAVWSIMGAMPRIVGMVAAISIAWMIMFILWLVYLYSGWTEVGNADNEFELQKTGAKVVVISVVLIVLLVLGFIAMLIQGFARPSPGPAGGQTVLWFAGNILIMLTVISILAIALVVGMAILAYGFHKLGEVYDEGATKTGGTLMLLGVIFMIIPFLNLVSGILNLIASILLIIGLGNLENKLKQPAQTQPTSYGVPPPPT